MPPVPAALFGQNFEHTRTMATGGLSAELVRNRKFAGKLAPDGVAQGWRTTTGGAPHVAFDHLEEGFTRHDGGPGPLRRNEIRSQKIMSLAKDGFADIAQGGLALCADRTYVVTAHLRGCFADEKVVWRLSLLPEAHCKPTTFAGTNATTVGTSWQTVSFAYVSPVNEDAELRIEVKGVSSGVVGAVSVLPTDHFHGMRRDVIAALKSETNRWRGRQ